MSWVSFFVPHCHSQTTCPLPKHFLLSENTCFQSVWPTPHSIIYCLSSLGSMLHINSLGLLCVSFWSFCALVLCPLSFASLLPQLCSYPSFSYRTGLLNRHIHLLYWKRAMEYTLLSSFETRTQSFMSSREVLYHWDVLSTNNKFLNWKLKRIIKLALYVLVKKNRAPKFSIKIIVSKTWQ